MEELSAQEELIKFLLEASLNFDGSIDNKKLLKTIVESNLCSIVPNLVKQIDKNLYFKMAIDSIKFKEKYNVFKNEIINITKNAEYDKIKLLHIKGYFLANDLYDPMESRIFDDIDLVIHENDMGFMIKLLNNLGYYSDMGNISPRKCRHIIFHKEIELNSKKLTIPLELHSDIFNPPYLFNNNVSLILDRATKYDWCDCHPLILDIYDRIIQLIIHFYIHFSNEYIDNLLLNKAPFINLRNLHDIALLIDKHFNVIDWKKLEILIDEYDACCEVSFVCIMVNSIYPNRFPKEFIENIICNKNNFKNIDIFSWIFNNIDYMDVKSIIQGDLYKNIQSIINNIKGPQLLCMRNNNHNKGTFIIDTQALSNLKVIGSTYWDELNLNIDIKVRDNVMTFPDINEYIWQRDSLRFMFIIPENNEHKSYVKSFFIFPVKSEDEYRLCIFNDNNEEGEIMILEKNKFNHTLNIDKNDYYISIKIPWTFLDIKPEIGRAIPFNIGILDYDKNMVDSHTKVMQFLWTGDKSQIKEYETVNTKWFNFQSIGHLLLI